MDMTTLLIEPLATRLGALQKRDSAAHTRLVGTLPALTPRLGDDAALADLVALCDQTAAAVPGLASDLITHLEYLLATLDVAGLRRWVLTGMRLYPNHPALLARYFRLDDPAAAQSMHAEANGFRFGAAHSALQYYLAGFGLPDVVLKARQQHDFNALPVRTVISEGVLLFPEHYLAIEGAGNGDIYCAAAAHALAHLNYSRRHRAVNQRKPMLVAVLSLIEDARVERLMARKYPGLHTLWGRFHVASGEAGDLSFASLTARLARALHDPYYLDPNHWVNKGRELFQENADRLDDAAAFDEVGNILANDLGQMRVRFNPQQYRVEPAYRDDNTLLWEFEEDQQDTPPEEMLARKSAQVESDGSDTESGVTMHILAIEPDIARRWHYPEWDYRAEIERDKWVTVIDAPLVDSGAAAPDAAQKCSTARNIPFDTTTRLLDRSIRLRRQYEGDELDLNAAIESRISLRGRIAPDPRIFQRTGRRRPSYATLLLLDLSESTNDRIKGTYTTVLDVEKRAAAIVAESIDRGQDRIAIHGFASNGRSDVRYARIKDFDQPFGDRQRQQLAQQRGALSTRMGAALRHAGSCLATEQAEKKMIILVTDGEPSDIDVYDSRYLIEDARYAVGVLAAQGISTFCLTLDQRADAYVRAIFGAWNYLIVDDPTALPLQVARALAKVSAR